MHEEKRERERVLISCIFKSVNVDAREHLVSGPKQTELEIPFLLSILTKLEIPFLQIISWFLLASQLEGSNFLNPNSETLQPHSHTCTLNFSL